MLELNDELVSTHRELVRQRSRRRGEGARRVRHLEAIAAAGLAGHDLDVVLKDVLDVIARAVDADCRGDPAARTAGWRLAAPRVSGGRRRGPRPGRRADRVAGVPLRLDGRRTARCRSAPAPGVGVRPTPICACCTPAAERAALAISRAQLLERERGIAETLQRALLPERLPEVPGTAARRAHFEPATGRGRRRLVRRRARSTAASSRSRSATSPARASRAAALMGELRGGLRAGVLGRRSAATRCSRRLDRLAERAGRMVRGTDRADRPRDRRAAPRERRPPRRRC